MISFGPLKPETELEQLLHASAVEFCADGYQQQRRYLDWLYHANPAGRGPADCLVARQDGRIVGCMHRMMLPLQGPDGQQRLGVLHNHFVADALRSGPGVLLLRRAVKDVDVGFAPGVQAPLDTIYRKLGFGEHPGFWLIRPIAPVAGAVQLARFRLGRSEPLRVDVDALGRRSGRDAITARPDASQLDRLCRAMRTAAPEETGVDWTPDLVSWRYFDPLGPRHLLITSGDTQAAAVIALGVRRGMTVARLLELHDADDAFLKRLRCLTAVAGAALGLVFTTDRATAGALQKQGWRLRKNGTFSFRTGTAPLRIGAGATDVGFEAFNTEWC